MVGLGELAQGLLREGPQGNGTEQAHLQPLGAQRLKGGEGDPGRGAVGGDDDLGVLALRLGPADLVLLHQGVFLRQMVVVTVALLRIHVQGVDDVVVVPVLTAGGGPVLGGQVPLGDRTPLDGLHHLANQAVHNHHDGVAVLVGNVKCLLDEVHRLLHIGGGEDQRPVIAVAAAAGGLIVIALAGLNGAQARTAAHAVDDDAGQLGAGDVCNALLFQADAGGGGRGHGPHAGAGGAVHHVDGRNLRLRLQEHAARLGQMGGHILRDLALRRDGIAEEAVAAGADGGLGDGFISFPKFFFHGR